MPRYPSTPDCAIKGCTRARHKADMCKAHYALVPLPMKTAASIKSMDASMRAAKAEHRKMLAYVRRALAIGTAEPQRRRSYGEWAVEAFGAHGQRAEVNYRNAPRIPRA